MTWIQGKNVLKTAEYVYFKSYLLNNELMHLKNNFWKITLCLTNWKFEEVYKPTVDP